MLPGWFFGARPRCRHDRTSVWTQPAKSEVSLGKLGERIRRTTRLEVLPKFDDLFPFVLARSKELPKGYFGLKRRLSKGAERGIQGLSARERFGDGLGALDGPKPCLLRRLVVPTAVDNQQIFSVRTEVNAVDN